MKLFTVAEANAALPLVRRITADVRVEYRAWRDAVSRYELEAGAARAEAGEAETLVGLRTEVQDHAARIAALVLELEAIGCQLKDFDQGLVDFYALADDRLVFLCWREGEEQVAWWHEVDAGFAGRRPIEQALFPGTIP